MRPTISCALLLSLVFTGSASSAPAPLTEQCNTNYGTGEVVFWASPGLAASMKALVQDPSIDPDLYERLWSPKAAHDSFNYVFLVYDRAQDTAEIVASMKADPRVNNLSPGGIYANTQGVCFSAGPPPVPMTVTEFYNRGLKHYFLSSSEAETAAIQAGSAGPGWEPTGESFRTIAPGYCYDARPVFRFYGARQNSHFFTVDTRECGTIRRQDPGWGYEGEAFGATLPRFGSCVGGTAVYRAYNGRWREDDSNHRFMVRRDLYDQMVGLGWIGEGVAFCLFNSPS